MNLHDVANFSRLASDPAAAATTDQAACIRHALNALRRAGAQNFDPAFFHHLTVLADRARTQREPVRRVLETRLMQKLAVFQDRFEQAQGDAARAIAAIAPIDPNQASALERLYLAGQFKAVKRSIAALEAEGPDSALAALIRQLAQPAKPFEAAGVDADTAAPAELKTMRVFRNTWSRLSVEKHLSQALEQPPKNAGPINPHSLVLRTLALMREISPDYLSRFTSYVDTLLQIDQHGGAKRALIGNTTATGVGKSANRRRGAGSR